MRMSSLARVGPTRSGSPRNAEVASHGKLQPAAEAVAADGRNGRSREVCQSVCDTVREQDELLSGLSIQSAHVGEVGSGTKGPLSCAGYDQHAKIVPGLQIIQDFLQRQVSGIIEGIQHRRPIEGERSHSVNHLDQHYTVL